MAQSIPETTIITSASYEVFRIIDNELVIPHGTGSTQHTYMSYDIEGNYFDLDIGGRVESVNLKNTTYERGFFPGAFSSTIKKELFANNTAFFGFDFTYLGDEKLD